MEKPWHALKPEEVMSELEIDAKGLNFHEAKNRLSVYGPNELKKQKSKSRVLLFLNQFTDILVIILLIATGLSFAVGETVEALIVLAIVIASASLGFIQEYRSEKAIEALKKMAAPTATVIREGAETNLPANQLVPGDIILLYTGDKVPADARIIEAHNLKIDEAALTGESAPINKNSGTLPTEITLNDKSNMVFSGTIITYGRGKAVVTSTGMNTEFGRIAQMVQTTSNEKTPLEIRMGDVGRKLGILTIVLCITVGAVGIILQNRPILDMILWSISLAVAAVPEALPAIVTGSLAIGMYRMAKVNTIVKRLPAVETLGCTSVICSDKTGTMTKGEMTVQRIFVNEKFIKVSGIGYNPEGEFILEGEKIEPDENLKTLLKTSSLCNDSTLEQDTPTHNWTIKGDSTEGALVVAAAKGGVWKHDLEKTEPRIDEIPFTSERKLMTTVHQIGNKKIAYMKGAPEVVLKKCTKILFNNNVMELNDERCNNTLIVTEALATQALRNLAFAYRELPSGISNFDETIEEDFVFVGIMSMIDPPRNEVKDAISICGKAGIRVVMITGDHKLTAIAVAKELNLIGEEQDETKVLIGSELEEMSDEELVNLVENVVIYARVSPEHKMRIIKAWKAKEQIVAMTGDGVNDAPALKMSDIGIAMGISGTEVTKEASDMILGDDNFASIVKAVREGREIYCNIKKFLTYLLQCNIMEILLMFTVMIFVPYITQIICPTASTDCVNNAAIALTAVQLLWVNLVTDGLPALALGLDPGDPDLMEQKPRKLKESIFSKDVMPFLTITPVLMTLLLLVAYFINQPWLSDYNLLESRTQLLNALIVIHLTTAISARSFKYPVFKVGIFKNKYLWYAVLSSFALQLFILYTPGVQSIFDINSPDLMDWIISVAFAAIVFFVIEFIKFFTSKRKTK